MIEEEADVVETLRASGGFTLLDLPQPLCDALQIGVDRGKHVRGNTLHTFRDLISWASNLRSSESSANAPFRRDGEEMARPIQADDGVRFPRLVSSSCSESGATLAARKTRWLVLGSELKGI